MIGGKARFAKRWPRSRTALLVSNPGERSSVHVKVGFRIPSCCFELGFGAEALSPFSSQPFLILIAMREQQLHCGSCSHAHQQRGAQQSRTVTPTTRCSQKPRGLRAGGLTSRPTLSLAGARTCDPPPLEGLDCRWNTMVNRALLQPQSWLCARDWESGDCN